jgi:hypothetical protein
MDLFVVLGEVDGPSMIPTKLRELESARRAGK